MRHAVETLALALLVAPAAALAGTPDWLARAAAQPTPAWASGYHAIVLLDSASIEVPATGRTTWHAFGVRRVLDTQGAGHVLHDEAYERRTGAVRALHGWVISPGGRVRTLGDDAVTEAAAHGEGELYSDSRHRVLAAETIAPGDVVAWECASDSDPFLADWSWAFADGDEPVVRSSLRLALPQGVEPIAYWSGPDSVAARREGQAWTWTRTALLPQPSEPLAPPSAVRARLLRVTARTRGSAPAGLGRTFADWTEVSAYLSSLADAPGAVTPEIAAAAARLTASARTRRDSLRALARGVQDMNYVAIDLNLGHGGGYTPHPAAQVLNDGYGDCKDKATLLRALAHAIGVEALLVSVFYGDPTFVTAEPATPDAFNHKIVAFRMPAGTRAPLAFDVAGLGTLLPFDPTDPVTPFGDLPALEQGALALVESGREGRLVALPVAPPEARATRLAIHAALSADGVLTGRLAGTLSGEVASDVESLRRAGGTNELRDRLAALLATPAGPLRADSIDAAPLDAAGTVRIGARLDLPGAARKAAGGLLVFRPAVACVAELPELPDSARRLPALLPLVAEDDSFAIALPAGLASDDLPAPVALHADFGDLDATWSLAAGTLRLHYALTTRRALLPPARYAELRRFCNAARAALYAPVVLAPR